MDRLETDARETETRQRIRKSNVRIVVTYFVVFMYCTTAVILTFVLLRMGKVELAIGVFSGLSTLSAGIAGFWFGNRSSGYPETMGDTRTTSDADTKVFEPLMGTARRPVTHEEPGTPAVFPGRTEKGKSK